MVCRFSLSLFARTFIYIAVTHGLELRQERIEDVVLRIDKVRLDFRTYLIVVVADEAPITRSDVLGQVDVTIGVGGNAIFHEGRCAPQHETPVLGKETRFGVWIDDAGSDGNLSVGKIRTVYAEFAGRDGRSLVHYG